MSYFKVREAFEKEIYRSDIDDQMYDWYDELLPTELQTPLKDLFQAGEYGELCIELIISGFYDPGCYSGPPERCYPAEYADDRELDFAYVKHDGKKWTLTDDLANVAFNHYLDKINDEDFIIDTYDNDY